jgi:tRNA 2-thiouridine synthesizing protein A
MVHGRSRDRYGYSYDRSPAVWFECVERQNASQGGETGVESNASIAFRTPTVMIAGRRSWGRPIDNPNPEPIAQQLDARGLMCPEPLMLARNALRGLQSGEVLEILATDPSTVRDFEQLCRFLGHELLHSEQVGGEYQFRIRRAG